MNSMDHAQTLLQVIMPTWRNGLLGCTAQGRLQVTGASGGRQHLHSLGHLQALVPPLLQQLQLALVVAPALLAQLVRPAGFRDARASGPCCWAC